MKFSALAKQIIDRQRSLFNTSYNSFFIFHSHSERIIGEMLDGSFYLPPSGRTACDNAMKEYKNGIGNFKKIVDENFDKMEAFLG